MRARHLLALAALLWAQSCLAQGSLVGIRIQPENFFLTSGKHQQLAATFNGSPARAVWMSSDPTRQHPDNQRCFHSTRNRDGDHRFRPDCYQPGGYVRSGDDGSRGAVAGTKGMFGIREEPRSFTRVSRAGANAREASLVQDDRII